MSKIRSKIDTITVTIALTIASRRPAIAEMTKIMPEPMAETTEPIANFDNAVEPDDDAMTSFWTCEGAPLSSY